MDLQGFSCLPTPVFGFVTEFETVVGSEGCVACVAVRCTERVFVDATQKLLSQQDLRAALHGLHALHQERLRCRRGGGYDATQALDTTATRGSWRSQASHLIILIFRGIL